jgi:hypothetical protein
MSTHYDAWPELPYNQFQSTSHLLHMASQIMGKLKLATPFEPYWSNVGLWLTTRGITTGLIPCDKGCFAVSIDFVAHEVVCTTTWNKMEKFILTSMSVAQFTKTLFQVLNHLQVNASINMKPQEQLNPVLFNEDNVRCQYDELLANAWWRILINSEKIMQRYHARFNGYTPAIALMWGTFDLRDARYYGDSIPTTGPNAGYIRRNAMNTAQVEAGWWHGNSAYQRPAYYSFMYPAPVGFELEKVSPEQAYWNADLGEFILDYDVVRQSKNPENTLFTFFESTYAAGAQLAGWPNKLIGPGRPI